MGTIVDKIVPCNHEYRPYSDGYWCVRCHAHKPYDPAPRVVFHDPYTAITPNQFDQIVGKLDEILVLIKGLKQE